MLSPLYFSGGNKKQVLITGDTGMIGRELSRRLKASADYEVTGLSELTGKRLDLQHKTALKQALQKKPFDVIYHLAALNPFKSNSGTDYFNSNVKGTEHLLDSVLELKNEGKNVPDVFLASSAVVYSPEKLNLKSFPDASPILESALKPTLDASLSQIKPESGQVGEALLASAHLSPAEIYYNDSKLLAEMAATHYARQGVPVKVGRLVNCYGKQSSQLINQLLAEKEKKKPLILEGKDPEPRDYLFCDGNSANDDVVRLIQAVAEKGKAGEAYNISSQGQFVRSPQVIANAIDQKNTFDVPEPNNGRAIFSNQKLKDLGVELPKTSPEEGIRFLKAKPSHGRSSGFLSGLREWFTGIFKTIQGWLGKLCFWRKTSRET